MVAAMKAGAEVTAPFRAAEWLFSFQAEDGMGEP